MISFSTPLLAIVASVLFILSIVFYLQRYFILARKVSSRIVLLALLLLALSQPSFNRESQSKVIHVLLDSSRSIDLNWADRALKLISDRVGLLDRIEIVPFAAKVAAVPVSDRSATSIREKVSYLDIDSTNLSNALDFVSGSKRDVFLISDGYQTKGNIKDVLAALGSAGVRIFPIAPELKAGESLTVDSIDAPLILAAGEPFSIRTTLSIPRDSSGVETVVSYAGEKVLTQRIDPNSGLKQIVSIPDIRVKEGVQEVKVELKQSGKVIHSRSVFVSSEVKEKILILSEAKEDSRILQEIIEDRGFKIEVVLKGDPSLSNLDLSRYSVVFLCNIAANSLPRKIIDSLNQFVRDGGGLSMIGGNNSFGLGGYIGTSVEPLLPVKLTPPETTKKRLSVGVALVMDKSGSMSESLKLDFAKEAAVEVINNLKDEDYIGVVGFDDAPFVVLDGAQVGSIRSVAREKIGRLFPAGRTNPLPAIDEGRRALAKFRAGRKHMIILTDGRIPDASPFYLEMMKELREEGITVSTVLLSSDSDYGFLKSLAEAGGGGYYQTSDARSLPRIFVKDVSVSTGERTLKESESFSVIAGEDIGQVTAINSAPPILGFVQTQEIGKADTELLVVGDQGRSPLLASWSIDKGRVLAYTSDISGRWSRQWLSWNKVRDFWGDIVTFLRGVGDNGEKLIQYDLRPIVKSDKTNLALEIFGSIDPGEVSAELADPAGNKRQINFKRVSPGYYTAEIADLAPGSFTFTPHGERGRFVQTGLSLAPDLFGERVGQGINFSVLNEIAEATGGKVNPDIAELLKGQTGKVDGTPLDLPLAVLAGIYMLFSIIKRER